VKSHALVLHVTVPISVPSRKVWPRDLSRTRNAAGRPAMFYGVPILSPFWRNVRRFAEHVVAELARRFLNQPTISVRACARILAREENAPPRKSPGQHASGLSNNSDRSLGRIDPFLFRLVIWLDSSH